VERRNQAAKSTTMAGRRAAPSGNRRTGDREDSGRARSRASGGTGRGSRPAAGAKTAAADPGRKTIAARISGISPRTVMILALFVLFVVLSVSPVTRNLEATTRLNSLEGELKNQRAVTESLEKDVAEAGTLDYVEKEARKQRLVAPGEILYLVTTDSSENEVKYRVKAIQSKDEAWARVRQMLHSVPRGQ
jgi:cell division protein FtsB